MRITSLSLGLALCLGGCSPAADAPQDSVTVSDMELDQMDIRDGIGRYVSTRGTVKTEIAFDVDLATLDPVQRHDSERIGQTDDGVIVLLDRYASRAQPGGRCARGIESFVRAFSLREKKQLLAVPAESCLTGKTGNAAKVTWVAPNSFRMGTRIFTVRGDAVFQER
jgi:hypothetical protein